MSTLFADSPIGRKNIIFGAFLFLLFALAVGIPLTLDFLGASVLSDKQYQLWKVVHGYGIFLGVINYFLGTNLDQLRLSGRQKEMLSWSFIVAGFFGAIVRMAFALLDVYDDWVLFASSVEAASFSVGLALFIYGWSGKKKGEPVSSNA